MTCVSASCGCITNNLKTQGHKSRMTSYFSCFWGWSGQSCSPCHSWEPLRMLGWAGGSPSKPPTPMWPWLSLLVVTRVSCPQPLPLDGTPFPRPSHMASFQQGAQVSLLTIPKEQSQRLLNTLRAMPGAVLGHVATASLRVSPGSRSERTLRLFIVGWPGCRVKEPGEAWGTCCEDPQCMWVWGVGASQWGMKRF